MNGKPLPTTADMAEATTDRDGRLVRQSSYGGLMPDNGFVYLWLKLQKALSVHDPAGRVAAVRALSDEELIDVAVVVRDGFPVIVAASEFVMAHYGPDVPHELRAMADTQLTASVYRVLDEPSRARLKGTPQ